MTRPNDWLDEHADARRRLAEEFGLWLAGLLCGSVIHLTDDATELEVHATEAGYLPSFTVRRGGVGVVVHIEPELP